MRRARGAVSSNRGTAAVLAIVTMCAAVGIFVGLTSTAEATAPSTTTLLAAPVQSPSDATVTGVSVTGQPSGSGLSSSSTAQIFVVRTHWQHIPVLVACFGVVDAGHPIIGDNRIDNSVRDN